VSTRSNLRESLPRYPEYRAEYADEILALLVCSQIKVLREQRKMSQTALANALGTTQSTISRIESADYAAWSVDTLRRIARALDVRLRITFESFGSLWQDVGGLNRSALERPTIEDDPEFTR
jgi:transcriptional regulator with XRE-family HTH domain